MAAPITRKYLFTHILSTFRLNHKRCYSQSSNLTNSQITLKRNELFDKEKERQKTRISRIEKINVQVRGPPDDCTLLMNKDISTPYNCAMHVQELLKTRSVIALVNGQPWDMHRPLTDDCVLEFQHFHEEDPRTVNDAFWRSCTLVLGHVLEAAFKDNYYVELVSFPPIKVQSGSFVYDVDLKLPNWNPTSRELGILSRIGYRLQFHDIKFERLDVGVSLAEEMFDDNQYKREQVERIAQKSATGKTVTLYRVGEFIDMVKGPCMSSTSQMGRFNVTAVHQIECPENGLLHRVQGVAIPTQTNMHYWSYNILCQRAANLNRGFFPGEFTTATPIGAEVGEDNQLKIVC